MRTTIDIDDALLVVAAKALGTATEEDTVSAALAFVARHRQSIEQLLEDPYSVGVGPDIGNPEVMGHARR